MIADTAVATDPTQTESIARGLSRLVPMLYLAMALYLGLNGRTGQRINWIYILSLGGFGVGGYMLLNEPGFLPFPMWVTGMHWFIFTMMSMLLMGVLVFYVAIKTQGLPWPWEWIEAKVRNAAADLRRSMSALQRTLKRRRE